MSNRSRSKIRLWLAVLMAAALLFGAYALVHWTRSASGDDSTALARQAGRYWLTEDLRLEVTARRGDYLAALCSDRQGRWSLCVFYRDSLWRDRWRAGGGKAFLSPGELDSWNYGSPQGEAVLIFCGYDLPEDVQGYHFQNGGVTYLCPVEYPEVLDIFIIPDGRSNINGTPVPLDALPY